MNGSFDNENASPSRKMHLVTIEWDGDKPPTVWYERLKKMGLRVRGARNGEGKEDKSVSPISRRYGESAEGKGVIVQEGTILCSSESLARTLRDLAYVFGAKQVTLGTFVPDDNQSTFTDQDKAYLARIQTAYGKRGPKKGELLPQPWTITCFEEARTYNITDSVAIMCPHCKGMLVQSRPGEQTKVLVPAGVPAFEAWKRTRFVTTAFEVPDTTQGASAPATVNVGIKIERDVADMLEKSTTLHKICAKLSPENALRLLDAVFCSRTRVSKETRNAARLQAVTHALSMGADPTKIVIAENPASADALDCAPIFGEQMAAQLFILGLQP